MKYLLICLILFQSICALAQEQSDFEFCKNELTEKIEELLKDDSKNILMESFNLSALKLSYKMQEDGGQDSTMETFIKKRAKFIKGADRAKLINKVSSLYEKFGKEADLSKISKIVDGLKNHNYFPASERLSNEEHSVIMLAFQTMQPCSKQSVCINDNDTAITWFMNEVAKKSRDKNSSANANLLEMSVKVAHLNGGLSETQAKTESELEHEILKKENKINFELAKVKTEFFNKFTRCKDLLNNACFKKVVEEIYPKSLKNILNELNKNQISSIDSRLKLKLIDGVALNLKNSLIFEKKPEVKSFAGYPLEANLPAEIVKSEKGPLMCGGKDFKSEMKDIRLWSFDPLKARAVKNNYGKAGKVPGTNFGVLCELVKLGPIQFHCTPWLKRFVLRKKSAKSLVCCNEKERWEDFTNLFASINGGLDLKAYLGVPFLNKIGVNAEVGLIGGFGAGFSIGGGEVPEGCINKNCIQAAVRTSVFLGGYFDIGVKRKVNSAIGGEFKVSWKPYLTARQCLYPESDLPPLEVKYSIGSIWLHGTIYAGWVFTYDFYEPIYKNDQEDSLSIPIF